METIPSEVEGSRCVAFSHCREIPRLPLGPLGMTVRICAWSILRRIFLSVRGYGLRTYEPRQGRNAATVV